MQWHRKLLKISEVVLYHKYDAMIQGDYCWSASAIYFPLKYHVIFINCSIHWTTTRAKKKKTKIKLEKYYMAKIGVRLTRL